MPTEIESLYREHRARLVRLVERELRDHQDAEDVVQTAFLDAQRALERGTIPRNPPAWLAAIALNSAHRLRRRRLNAEPLEEYAVQEASRMSEIRPALASLPREQRAAVLYRDVLGLSYGETAEQMGTSVNAVTMLLHRGRQRLRQTLAATVGGLGLWRWSKHAGMPQVAMVKGAAALLTVAGLATTGIVAARAVAPIGTDRTAASVPRPGRLTAPAPAPAPRAERVTAGAGRAPLGTPTHDSARRQSKPDGSTLSASPASPPGSAAEAKQATTPSSTAEVVASVLPATLRVPTVSLPTKLPIPSSPVTVAATVTVSTPIVSATVAAPIGLTATTPTTVSVTIP